MKCGILVSIGIGQFGHPKKNGFGLVTAISESIEGGNDCSHSHWSDHATPETLFEG